MNCPYCQDEQQQVKAGRTALGKQRYKCKQCQRRYTYHAQPSSLDAKKVIYKKSLIEYETGMKHFFDQLVQLNVNIYIMENIFAFPLALFTGSHENTFFRAVIRNFFDASILTITRLATDMSSDFYTLPQFKNWLFPNIKRKYRTAFQAHLKNAKFDVTTDRMLKKARDIRDARIAHLKKEYVVDSSSRLEILYFDDLKSLRDLLNKQLRNTLAFNVDYMMLPMQYSSRIQHPVGSDPRADIEKVLDLIARDSYLLNMPEAHPDRWIYQKKRLNEDELNQLNYYRRRFNLRAV